MKHILASLLLFLSIPTLFAQSPTLSDAQLKLQALTLDPGLKHGQISVMVQNLDNGTMILEHNIFKSMIPASIQKLYTTGVALQTLRPDHRFTTIIGYTGELREGTLHGNLVIIGGGDPTLDSRYFSEHSIQKLVEFVKENGIKTINGKLVLDLSYFERYTTPRGWIWEDIGNYFGASPNSLMYDDNLIEVKFRSGQEGSRAMVAGMTPKPDNLEMNIEVEAANSNRDDAWFFGAPGSSEMYAKGSIPSHRSEFNVKAANPKVAESFVQDFIKKSGIKAEQIEFLYRPFPDELIKSKSVESPTVAEIVNQTNLHSINLFAEALLIQLDTASEARSTEGGIETLQSVLKKNKVYQGGLNLEDGSGLSPLNRTTAQSMVHHLAVMYRSDVSDQFLASLPVAGQSGTIKNTFGGPLTGKMMAKSGTMNGVRNYTGYIKNQAGETIAFCVMMNDYDENRKAELMRKLQDLLASIQSH